MTIPRVELATLNNALWCNAVCAAHGVPGEVQANVWLNRNIPPPYHSNLVVISSHTSQAEIDGHIRELSALPLSPSWSVKDSFMSMDLAPQGFGVLFAASWIWLAPERVLPKPAATTGRCIRVSSPADLAAWETGWRGDAGNEQASQSSRQFPEALLSDSDIAFLACVSGDRIVAGGAVNRTPGAIGLSNIFVSADDIGSAWAGLTCCARGLFPGLPIVGYEKDADLLTARELGFESLGKLRVWIRQP